MLFILGPTIRFCPVGTNHPLLFVTRVLRKQKTCWGLPAAATHSNFIIYFNLTLRIYNTNSKIACYSHFCGTHVVTNGRLAIILIIRNEVFQVDDLSLFSSKSSSSKEKLPSIGFGPRTARIESDDSSEVGKLDLLESSLMILSI